MKGRCGGLWHCVIARSVNAVQGQVYEGYLWLSQDKTVNISNWTQKVDVGKARDSGVCICTSNTGLWSEVQVTSQGG